MEERFYLDETNIKKAFAAMDVDRSGFITLQNLEVLPMPNTHPIPIPTPSRSRTSRCLAAPRHPFWPRAFRALCRAKPRATALLPAPRISVGACCLAKRRPPCAAPAPRLPRRSSPHHPAVLRPLALGAPQTVLGSQYEPAKAAHMLREFDDNGDNKIEWSEFLAIVQAPPVARPENLGRRDKDDYSYIHLHGL